ncbi:TetR/AcrR family transcriptional regulator (plasmid) [Sphingobium sp. V4]|uniref:TetR/AcrR family transcriptional regulator n=1 Tax=Sphingobium sp. V4 TaxID=3038927 RepID=UPI002557D456|nr:TetR/AcrR family transcriptional regulator [Sphingobium sp. V4]WIW90755.1 TetR/AcrR family transcriptional regulator [Sphingobium sp. V4]
MSATNSEFSGLSMKAQLLVDTVLAIWMERGTGEMSARSIGSAAGFSPSALYYHFDDIERLYEAAQERAVAMGQSWCDAKLAMLDEACGADAPSADALGPVLAALIDDFCTQERMTAFAWRECQMLAGRSARFATLSERWDAVWRHFWQQVCAHFDMADKAELCRHFFDGESGLHLMRWNRAADRASLDEMAAAWVGWLMGELPRHAPWRRSLMARAIGSGGLDKPDGLRLDIARAAAALLADGGVGAITHRAVAAATGLTLGVVSHNCRRTDDLLRLAYGEVYRSLTSEREEMSDRDGPSVAPVSDLPARLQLRAIDELILAVARGRTDAALTLQLRYLRGITSRQALVDRVALRGEAFDLLAAVYSSAMMGVLRSSGCQPEDDASPVVSAVSDQLLSLLPRAL